MSRLGWIALTVLAGWLVLQVVVGEREVYRSLSAARNSAGKFC